MRKKMLVFHPALAPYRVDFFNSLASAFDAHFYFSYGNLLDQKFDQNELRKQCTFEFNLLTAGFELGRRPVRIGVFSILFRHKPDIVICSEYSQITLMVLLLKLFMRFKYRVYTISDDSVDIAIKRKGIRKFLMHIVSHLVDGIIFPSDLVCEWYHKEVNAKTALLKMPIVHDNEIFRAKISQSFHYSDVYRETYQLYNKKVFLFVGRFVKIKNIAFLLNAFERALKDNNTCRLVVVGEGEEEADLKMQACSLGVDSICIFPGRFEGTALYAWYNIADCLVLPSYQEPYGVVVNEALLAGCKVLCSNHAGSVDLLDKHNGLAFDPYNIDTLIDGLKTVYEETMIDANRGDNLRPDLMPSSFNAYFEVLRSQLI